MKIPGAVFLLGGELQNLLLFQIIQLFPESLNSVNAPLCLFLVFHAASPKVPCWQ